VKRSVDKLLDDIIQAAAVADEIVRRGRANVESDPVAQCGAEAVIGRIGDAAAKLSDGARMAMPDVPWKEIIGFRIVIDHAYHRLDYGRVWNTLCDDIPRLRAAIERSRG
jgi:uncharacterized protein with HEPN domain